MKKIVALVSILLIALIVLILFLVSNNQSPEPSSEPSPVPESTEKAETTEEIERDPVLYLTVPEMERVEDLEVKSGAMDNEEYLEESALHVEDTGYPWQDGKNVYIAGHRLGYEDKDSWKVFWDLDELEKGDRIYLEDSEGEEYEYKVTSKKVVAPDDLSVLESNDKDMVTLQTCTLPDYKERIVVFGEKVS